MIGWIATALSLFGIFLNAKGILWCWPVWLASNVFWLALGVSYGDPSMIASQFCFAGLNVYGWRNWHLTNKKVVRR